jgi:hypothetical protein
MPAKNEIIYPIFLECCQFAEDTFWENIFEDLAYGKYPYGTYINKGFICCSYKGKEFSYKIERKDPRVLYDDLYGLFSTRLGILSQKEKLKKRLDFHEVEKNIKESRQKWSDIRKKNIKDLLIERYVIKLRRENSLSIKQAKYLLSLISLAILFKIITSKDITYEDDEIKNIEGIEIVNGKIVLKHSIYNIMPSSSPKITVVSKKMSDNWEKYLKQLAKNER